jgi:uncharacterized membrane protein YvbJ
MGPTLLRQLHTGSPGALCQVGCDQDKVMDEETIVEKERPAKKKIFVPIAAILIVIIIVILVVTFGNRSTDEQRPATPQVKSISRFIL